MSSPANGFEEILEGVRAIALELPETTERVSHGTPAFFVRDKKQFIKIVNGIHGSGEGSSNQGFWASAPPGVQAEIVGLEPARFYVPPYVGHRGWIGVRLDHETLGGPPDWDETHQIIIEAYANVAPKTLVARLPPH